MLFLISGLISPVFGSIAKRTVQVKPVWRGSCRAAGGVLGAVFLVAGDQHDVLALAGASVRCTDPLGVVVVGGAGCGGKSIVRSSVALAAKGESEHGAVLLGSRFERCARFIIESPGDGLRSDQSSISGPTWSGLA